MYYTLGQRQGLGIGGLADYPEIPWFVAGKNLTTNELIVVQGQENALLYSDWLFASEIFWISGSPPQLPLNCHAKVRYRQADQACTLEPFEGGYRVIFKEKQRAVTPGQSLVLYQNELCLGGGVIEYSSRDLYWK